MGIYAMTGGATGIGAAIKRQLRERGDTVIVVDIKDADIIADLSTAEGRAAAVEGVKAASPDGLDGWIPCAGLGPSARPAALISAVNYFGAVETTEALQEHLAKKNGRVVLISSNSAPMSMGDDELVDIFLAGEEAKSEEVLEGRGDAAFQAAYGGSKLALARWMRRNVTAWAKAGVAINAVAPGIVTTPLTDAVKKDPIQAQLIADFAAAVPAGREGTPDDIANMVSFLLSDAAAFCYGSVFFVDGGSDAMLRPDDF
jgi:NAD(P)-dependent dehydrogenase (short-subunit alcohol dehydrogenase family)